MSGPLDIAWRLLKYSDEYNIKRNLLRDLMAQKYRERMAAEGTPEKAWATMAGPPMYSDAGLEDWGVLPKRYDLKRWQRSYGHLLPEETIRQYADPSYRGPFVTPREMGTIPFDAPEWAELRERLGPAPVETGEPMDIAMQLLKGQYFHPSIRGYIDARSPGGVVQRRHRTRPKFSNTQDDYLRSFWDKHSFQTIPQMELPTMGRQTTLGEHHPDFPSPHGPVVYVHGTKPSNIPSIQQHGLIAGHGDYSGNFVSTNPDVKEIYGNNPMRQWEGIHRNLSGKGELVGIRAGAGTPEPYFGYSNDEQERYFPNHWLYNKDIDPKFLVNMGEESTPRALPEFYVDGKPPEFPEGLSNFDWEEWKSKWGAQT